MVGQMKRVTHDEGIQYVPLAVFLSFLSREGKAVSSDIVKGTVSALT